MPSCSRKFCTGLFSLLVVLSAVPLSADTFTAFGPKTYVRLSGTPVTVTDNFSILNPSTQYTLVVTNNGITNGIITINGVQVAVESDFTNNPTGFQKSITLKSSDQIGVRLFAPVGGSIIVEIMGAVGTATATHFTLAAPASATSGVAFSFTVTAQDQFNNPATGYSGTAHFTSSDGAATLPADSTLSNGTGTFSATLKTAGSRTITATDTVSSSITGTSGAITVSPAAATHFTLAAPASATSGVAFSFTVTAQDQFNNTVTGYSGTVHFSSSDGAATLPVDSTLSSGTGTFSATLKTAGSQAITATDTVSSSITGTSGAITVSPAAATHFTLAAPASATSGVAFSFTVTAQDQFNNPATGYSGTVHFTSSDAQAALPGNYTFTAGDAGTHTFSATLKTAGTQSITATDTASGTITGSQTGIVVNSAPLTSIIVTPANSSAMIGTTVPFTATGVYLDNSTQNLTNSVTWAATNLGQLNSYKQTNLVSDTQGLAPVVDPKLINPWGVAFLPGGPFWVADNGSGFATLYNQSGAIQGSYAIPGPNGSSAPTGIVANTGGGFLINGAASQFIFDTEGGTILGWNGGSAAVLALDNSASGAVYKGLALIQKGSSQFLLATNFNSGNVDIFDTTFTPATFTGTFTDPTLPAGYAPFGIEVINGQVVVTYALQDATKKQAVRQAGAGYV